MWDLRKYSLHLISEVNMLPCLCSILVLPIVLLLTKKKVLCTYTFNMPLKIGNQCNRELVFSKISERR